MSRFTDIIALQKKELEDKFKDERIIKRDFLSNAKKLVDSKLIKVVIGARRAGKSIFCAEILEGKVYGYVNFDDEVLATIDKTELSKVMESVYEVYGKLDYLFLDEIQNIDGWELFANRLQRQGMNLVISGSNAKLLSKELATHLTGRHLSLEIFPFSFREYLMYKDVDISAVTEKEKGMIKHHLLDYIKNGGFPETFNEPDVKSYLKNLYTTIVMKDILVKNKVRYQKSFRELANYMITNFARELSFNKFKKIFNLGSDHTAKNYISYLEDTYLIFMIEKFSFKKKQSLMENRKSYVIDTGLINAISFKVSEDNSHLYENLVAVELLRRSRKDSTEVFFWKDSAQHEVDFLVKKGNNVDKLIQVCYNVDMDNKKREIRSLLKAGKELKCNNLIVLTEDYQDVKEESWFGITSNVVYMPLWKWLLDIKS